MKTNKLWSIIMMLMLTLSSSVALSSCGDDDEKQETSSLLCGTWEEVNRESYKNGEIVSEGKNKWTKGWKWFFQGDGKLVHFQNVGEEIGTYKYNGNEIQLNYHVDMGNSKSWNESYKVTIIELTESRLVWKEIYTDTEFDYQIYYLEKTTSKYDNSGK